MSISTTALRFLKYAALIISFIMLAGLSSLCTVYMSVGKDVTSSPIIEAILEKSLASGFDDAVVEIKDLKFSRDSLGAPITMVADKIRIYPKEAQTLDDENAIISPSLQTGAIAFELSPFNILRGDIIVQDIKLEDLQLFAFLNEDERYVSAFKNNRQQVARDKTYDPSFLIPINPLDLLKYVGKVNIDNALVLAYDPETKETQNLARIDLNLRRVPDFDQSLLTLNVYEGDDINKAMPTFDLTVTSTDQQDDAEIVAYVAGFHWRDLMPWVGVLNQNLTEINGKVSGDMRLTYDKDTGQVKTHDLHFASQSGSISGDIVQDKSVHYEDMIFKSRNEETVMKARIEDRMLNVGIQQATDKDSAYHVSGDIDVIRAEDIAQFLPKDDQDIASEWINDKLKEGVFKDMKFTFDVIRHEESWDAENVVASFQTENLWVQYLRALAPISQLNASARYENDNLFIDIQKGQVSDLSIAPGGHLEISNLTKTGAGHLVGNLDLTGPLQGILTYLDNDIIRYKERVDISLEQASGDVNLGVKLDFPTTKDVAKEAVHVDVEGTVSDLKLPNVAGDFSVTGGTYDLVASENFLELSGKGSINMAPSDIAYTLYFAPDANAEFEQKFTSNGALTPEFLGQTLGTSFANVMRKDSQYELSFMQPVQGNASLNLKVLGDDFSIGDAQFKFGSGFNFQQANFKQVKLGKTQGDIDISQNNKGGMDISFVGPVINAAPFIDLSKDGKNKTSTSQATSNQAHNNISIKSDRVLGHEDMALNSFLLDLKYNNRGDFSQLNLNATHGGEPLKIRFSGGGDQGDSLDVSIRDVGALLKALDITNGVRGGTVSITGNPAGQYGSIQGRADITDFTARNVPVLGRLLNAISLPGLLQLFTNDGIDFSRLESDFEWSKQNETTSILILKNGRTKGSSLGLTFEGTYNPKTENLDMAGNVVPLSTVNNIISAVPLVGDLLTGGKNSSLVAVNYTMKGAAGDPDVFVNPLSILAPGILRRMLFESGAPETNDNGASSSSSAPAQKEQVPANNFVIEDDLSDDFINWDG